MTGHQRRYNALRFVVDNRLRGLVKGNSPREVKDACRFVLSAGGKRVRSTLLLLSCEAVGGTIRDAVDGGAAVELMHNFTLVHDDIMDNAPSRRGRPTVHTKWNVNTALLVGDILLGLAYKQALKARVQNPAHCIDVFTKGLLDVCEGQAMDLEFERRMDVSVRDYFRMIEKKTARLISTSTELGGIIGGGTRRQIESLRMFGHYLGRAFQLQDDLLDVIGKEKDFGKTIGGDIIEGKRTFLLLKALEESRGGDRSYLMQVMKRRLSSPVFSVEERRNEVRRIADIYRATGVIEAARVRVRRDTQRAEEALRILPRCRAKETLLWFSQMLLMRKV
ncbi:MAG: polyprenyl synthetase family protein [Bacteroidetes bacterium]|nr:polyprenyl synthetase family protein [Bacteroidota bacterium]MCW5896633.1 polyprenyl synthetase family protein [Bacteroidota bacterium]